MSQLKSLLNRSENCISTVFDDVYGCGERPLTDYEHINNMFANQIAWEFIRRSREYQIAFINQAITTQINKCNDNAVASQAIDSRLKNRAANYISIQESIEVNGHIPELYLGVPCPDSEAAPDFPIAFEFTVVGHEKAYSSKGNGRPKRGFYLFDILPSISLQRAHKMGDDRLEIALRFPCPRRTESCVSAPECNAWIRVIFEKATFHDQSVEMQQINPVIYDLRTAKGRKIAIDCYHWKQINKGLAPRPIFFPDTNTDAAERIATKFFKFLDKKYSPRRSKASAANIKAQLFIIDAVANGISRNKIISALKKIEGKWWSTQSRYTTEERVKELEKQAVERLTNEWRVLSPSLN